MKIFLSILIAFILLFIWCSLRIASISDQYEIKEKTKE